MNRILTFSFILITLLTTNSFGQDTGFLQGYVITNSSDTIKGLVKYINPFPYRILPDIKYKENKDSESVEYAPTSILGFKAGFKIFHSMSETGRNEDKVFMELLVDGYLRLYESKMTKFGASTYGANTAVSRFLIKSGENKLFNINQGKFKDSVSEYLSDNPPLSEMVKKGKYKKIDIARIAREYNKTRIVE